MPRVSTRSVHALDAQRIRMKRLEELGTRIPLTTTKGREKAIRALWERRKNNKNLQAEEYKAYRIFRKQNPTDSSDLRISYCVSCNDFSKAEYYRLRDGIQKKFCPECQALKDCSWLTE